jgi:general secretion pathway protein B
VESYRAPVTSAPPASSQNTGPATASSSGRPASEASRPGSTFQRLANARNNTATTNPGKAAAATTKPGTEPAATSAAPDQPVTTRPAGTEQPQRDPRETQPISYWELPDAIRESVPEIKFSVLVYAKNPADRFVLINGQRLGEGDTAQPGLVVKEIRLDGVVFSYRLYQFLVER